MQSHPLSTAASADVSAEGAHRQGQHERCWALIAPVARKQTAYMICDVFTIAYGGSLCPSETLFDMHSDMLSPLHWQGNLRPCCIPISIAYGPEWCAWPPFGQWKLFWTMHACMQMACTRTVCHESWQKHSQQGLMHIICMRACIVLAFDTTALPFASLP